MRPTGAHNPKASNKTSVKEQIRRISAIRVSLNACGRRVAMSTSDGDMGTVFQTATLFRVIIPRLRPGLLSLCSVLPSRQILSVQSVGSVVEWKPLRSFFFSRTRIWRIERMFVYGVTPLRSSRSDDKEIKIRNPLLSPCEGETGYVLRLEFPNCVSAIFHFSLKKCH